MNSKERLLAAMHHEPVDHVPANVTYYMAEFTKANFADDDIRDPFERALDRQLRFGFDPLVGVGGGNARPWLVSDPGRWESRQEEHIEAGHRLLHHVVRTPAGELTTDYMPDRGLVVYG